MRREDLKVFPNPIITWSILSQHNQYTISAAPLDLILACQLLYASPISSMACWTGHWHITSLFPSIVFRNTNTKESTRRKNRKRSRRRKDTTYVIGARIPRGSITSFRVDAAVRIGSAYQEAYRDRLQRKQRRPLESGQTIKVRRKNFWGCLMYAKGTHIWHGLLLW